MGKMSFFNPIKDEMKGGTVSLDGKRVAVLAEDLYEDPELWYPYYRLLEAGAEVTVVGPEAKVYASKHGYPVTADVAASEVSAGDFDGVVVPGGFAPDKLRRYAAILDLVRGVFEKGGIVAAICHAGWVPISAGIMEGKRATCVSAIKDDMILAHATRFARVSARDHRGIGGLISTCKNPTQVQRRHCVAPVFYNESLSQQRHASIGA
jgi:protease I